MRNNESKNLPPKSCDPCVPWLMKLSKAALVDCVVDLLSSLESTKLVSEDEAIEKLKHVILWRRDKLPKGKR